MYTWMCKHTHTTHTYIKKASTKANKISLVLQRIPANSLVFHRNAHLAQFHELHYLTIDLFIFFSKHTHTKGKKQRDKGNRKLLLSIEVHTSVHYVQCLITHFIKLEKNTGGHTHDFNALKAKSIHVKNRYLTK